MRSHNIAAATTDGGWSDADLGGEQGDGWFADLAWRSGGDGTTRAALFVSGTVLSQAVTRTIHSKNRGDLSVRDTANDAGAIHWIGSIKKLRNMTLIGSGR